MEPMDEVAHGFHEAMGSKRKVLLFANLIRHQERNESGQRLKVASGCSGSDVFKDALSSLTNIWKDKHGMPLEVDHVFSVDHDAGKRKWLIDHFELSYLFSEMKHVGEGNAYDVLTSKWVVVPTADIWIFGFECDSISSLNPHASQNRTCAQDFSEKTGSSLGHALAYEKYGLPTWIVIEITRTVHTLPKDGSKSVYQMLTISLNRRGIYVMCQTLWAQKYGPPNSRGRVWIVGQRISGDSIDQTAEGFHAPGWAADLRSMYRALERPPLPLDRFLLGPLESTVILHGNDSRFEKPKEQQTPPSKKNKGEDYKAIHLHAFSGAGLKWPPDWSGPWCHLWNKVQYLSNRHKEIVYYYTTKNDGLETETSHDLNFNLMWDSNTEDIVCCVATSSFIWLRRRERLLFGEEALALQGVGHRRQSAGREFYSQSECYRVAGDAFNGFVAMLVFLCLFTVDGLVPQDREAPASSRAKHPACVGEVVQKSSGSRPDEPPSDVEAEMVESSTEEGSSSDDLSTFG